MAIWKQIDVGCLPAVPSFRGLIAYDQGLIDAGGAELSTLNCRLSEVLLCSKMLQNIRLPVAGCRLLH